MSKEVKTIGVNGMSCSHCVHAVKTAVGALEGVEQVEVDLNGKKATVTFDPEKVTLQQVKDAIEDQGYDVAE